MKATAHRTSCAAAMTVVAALGVAATAPASVAAATATLLPAPTQVTMSPTPTMTSHGPWIGLTQSVSLGAYVTDITPGHSVYGDFVIVDATTHQVRLRAPSGFVVDGPVRVSTWATTLPLVDGHRYTWSVKADNGTLTSARVAGPPFSYDGLPPTLPTVTSSDFPPDTGSDLATLHVGQTGHATLAAIDPVGPSGRQSGLARIDWQLGASFGSVSAPPDGPNTGSTSRGKMEISLTPYKWGTNTLYVRSVDGAGNMSQTQQYGFYVPS